MAGNDSETDALKKDIEQQVIKPQAVDIHDIAEREDVGGDHDLPQQRSISRQFSEYAVQFEEETTKEKVACIATYLLLIASAPAIAAVIIASQYDENNNSCNDGTKYLIHPQTYLYVAGGVQLAMSIIYFFTQIVAFVCFSPAIWESIKFFMSQGLCRLISSCYPLWHLIWACIGIYIYIAEMSENCQNEDIGIMILSWCIIEFIGVCCISCIVMCWIFIALTVMSAQ